MTARVLIGRTAQDTSLREYACTIVDEAHERTVEVGSLLTFLNKIMEKRNDFKVCSAFV